MDQRILLPTDFSKNALNAIRYATDLYAEQECTFFLLHVYKADSFSIDGSAYRPKEGERSYEIEKKKTEEQFEKLMKMLRLRPANPKHTFEIVVTYDTLFDAAKAVIAKRDIDMIFMGTKGMTGSRTVIFGTNTIKIMEGITECPVLAVPEDIGFSPFKEIVFPTDFKNPFKRRELIYMTHIAQLHHAFIRILYIRKSDKLTPEQQDHKVLLESILKNTDHSFHELEDLSVQAGINAFLESRNSSMVAFMNRKHSFFSSILSKPLVKELGYHSKVPVLVLKDWT